MKSTILIVISIITFLFLVGCTEPAVCGNNVVESGEDCDNSQCPTGSICENCKCQPLPPPPALPEE